MSNHILKYNLFLFHLIFFSYLNCISTFNDTEINLTINNEIFELNASYIINQIIFTKVDNNTLNYLFGIFEASNNITFDDAVPIAIIKEENIKNLYTDEISINISIQNPYQFIRYIPPNNKTPKINDIKISCHEFSEVENTSEQYFFQLTNLPLIIINTENSTEPNTKKYYINSQIIIINENKIEINQTASIKLRGQSTSNFPKKPYKIKFDKKQQILGLSGKYKKWTLLANYLDKTLIRNILAFKISEIIGLEFTPRCKPVDLIMNGNFRGNYFICDQIEVNKGRIDIEEMTEDDISGGYLIEIDSRAANEEKYFKTDKGILIEIKYPDSDDITEAQENYIKQFMNILEINVYNGNLSYIDLDSFYKYFIIQEFCGDIDTVLSSFHCTKRKGIDKLYFGPVWDFDRSFDNDKRLIPTNEKPKFTLYYGDSSGTCRDFIITLLGVKNVMSNINQTWNEIKKNGLNPEVLKEFIKEKKELLHKSANLNNLRWYGSKIGEGQKDYFDSFNTVVNYLEQRFNSLSYLINISIKDENQTLNSTSITYIKENNISNEFENLDSSVIIPKIENNTLNELGNLSSNIIIPQLENNQSLNELNGIDSDKVINKEEKNISQTLLKINSYIAYLFILLFI